MATELVGVSSFVVIIGMVMLRVPVAVAMGIVGTIGYAIVDDWSSALNRIGNTPFELAEGYALSVVPLFMLMGAVASRSGMSQDLFRAANGLFAGRRGTAAMAAVGASAGFGAICGSSLATAATMSRIAIPEMRRLGYDERLAVGAVASGGTLAILIPPSVILIVYAVMAQDSVAQLFAAALIPGLVLTVLHLIVIWALCRWRPELAPAAQIAMRWPERLKAIAGMWQIVVLFGVSVGGIYIGFFSPTEAAAVGCLGAMLIGFATKRIGREELVASLVETVRTTAVLFFIVIMAFVYAYFLILTHLPQSLVGLVTDLQLSPLTVMLLLVAFYVVLGCFLDSLGMILITVPVFLPLVLGLGYDSVWFGVLVVVVVEIGLITPPIGMNLFVIRAQQPEIGIGSLYRGVLPFLAADAAFIALLFIFPALALWLPRVLFG
ncbi:MAG TPA: TRAP transporter large permease [Gammaproteobacteria bacterium]|nr:TRAP transporter large permease [Gammaproteobacteria bacterium]